VKFIGCAVGERNFEKREYISYAEKSALETV
jgi:hypothetical protein